ncbi:MAG: hypothetical protein WC747_03440 [Candidatus Babeliales bacterium]|jgi:hypothetical protein
MNAYKSLMFLGILFLTQSSLSTGEVRKNEPKRFFGRSNIFSAIISSPEILLKKLIKYQYPTLKPSAPVAVQITGDLCSQEKLFLQNRLKNVQVVLKDEFEIDKPLKVAFCCSGGGNRAMIGTLGFLTGAVKSKVFDATLYVAGLSGATWTIAPLCYLAATGHYENTLDILIDMKLHLFQSLSEEIPFGINGIYPPPLLPLSLSDNFFIEVAKRVAYDQPISLINVYGPLVANYSLELAGDNRLDATWSSVAPSMQSGRMPLPLCASIYETTVRNYEWFEMSPFQAGSIDLGYVPVEYLGSEFSKGQLNLDSVKLEYPISFYLGMYGSAFAATVQDLNEEQLKLRGTKSLADNLFQIDLQVDVQPFGQMHKNALLSNSLVQNYIKDLIQKIIAERNPITYAKFPNYRQDGDTLGLFDAGIDFNLPVPTLINRPERALDIIIMYDSNPGDLQTIREIAAYGKRKGLLMPEKMSEVTLKQLSAETMTVFNDPRTDSYNKNVATYLYFPTKDIDVTTAPYVTFNFRYLPEYTEFLASKMEQAFLSQVVHIKEIMQLVAHKKYIA